MSEPAPVPADQEEALREEIARFLWTARYGSLPSASWDQAVEIAEDIPDGRAAGSLREMRMQADRLLAGPLATLRAERDQLASELREARDLIQAYEEANADKHRLAREIDVAMHGEEGAAKQPSLCNLVGPAADLRAEVAKLRGALKPFARALSENTIRGADLIAARAALSDPRPSPAKGDDHHG